MFCRSPASELQRRENSFIFKHLIVHALRFSENIKEARHPVETFSVLSQNKVPYQCNLSNYKGGPLGVSSHSVHVSSVETVKQTLEMKRHGLIISVRV